MKVFGVDFDGTLSFGKWPDVGPANEELIMFLQSRKICCDFYIDDKAIAGNIYKLLEGCA